MQLIRLGFRQIHLFLMPMKSTESYLFVMSKISVPAIISVCGFVNINYSASDNISVMH
jgi:hypothetical protein